MMEQIPLYHILLADDDQDHSRLFRHILHKIDSSLKLSWVKDGDELLKFLRSNTVDLVFLDLKMPCKNGYECLEEIKNDWGLKEIPIIVYSSSCQMTDIQKCFKHQADIYMVKPFSSEHLKKALLSVLEIGKKGFEKIRRHYFINNQFVPYTATY